MSTATQLQASNQASSSTMNAPVFIVGVLNRCGTNFLGDIIKLIPGFSMPRLKEDYLLEHASCLQKYVDESYHRWQSLGEDCKSVMMEKIGNGLLAFLDHFNEEGRRIVVKTPRPSGVELFPQLFPSAKLLLLVRDGRDVVESAARSFTWGKRSYWMRQWKDGARILLDFMNGSGKRCQEQWMLVRYEKLVEDPQATISEILNFVKCDGGDFDWEGFDNLPIRGSSQTKTEGGKLHWKPIAKDGNFKPIGRWESWTWWQKKRFQQLCGPEMEQLGFSI